MNKEELKKELINQLTQEEALYISKYYSGRVKPMSYSEKDISGEKVKKVVKINKGANHNSCSLCFDLKNQLEKIEIKLDLLLNKDTFDWHHGRMINGDPIFNTETFEEMEARVKSEDSK